MNVAGCWKISGNTIAGRQEGLLVFEDDGQGLKGCYHSSVGKTQLNDIAIAGNEISWRATVRFPLPITSEFKGTIIDDDNIVGAVRAGVFGTIQLSAVRTRDPADR